MADRFDTLLREFQRVCEEITVTEHNLEMLKVEREDLKKRLRVLAANATQPVTSPALAAAAPTAAPLVPELSTNGGPPASASQDEPFRQTLRVYKDEEPAVVPAALRATVDVLRDLGGEATIEQVREKLGIKQEAARLRLARACNLKLIRRVAKGRYGLPSPGEKGATLTDPFS